MFLTYSAAHILLFKFKKKKTFSVLGQILVGKKETKNKNNLACTQSSYSQDKNLHTSNSVKH